METGVGLVLLIAVLAANLPFMTTRVLGVLKVGGRKGSLQRGAWQNGCCSMSWLRRLRGWLRGDLRPFTSKIGRFTPAPSACLWSLPSLALATASFGSGGAAKNLFAA